eukprot:scaffold106388_cov24-Tisochrysis_lutea.AAC.1
MIAALLALTASEALNMPTALATNPALAKTYRRAEFWNEGSATLLDIVNVLGRWQSSSEWEKRTEFIEVEDVRESTEMQAYSIKRYEMAQRLGQVERVALIQNTPKLRFTDEALAKGFGLTAKDFNSIELNPVAVNIVFDALAQSKNSLLPKDVVDDRRRGFVTQDGSLNEAAFSFALMKARSLVRNQSVQSHGARPRAARCPAILGARATGCHRMESLRFFHATKHLAQAGPSVCARPQPQAQAYLIITSWSLNMLPIRVPHSPWSSGNFIGFLILLKVLTDTTGVGGNLLDVLLERQDLVVLGLGTAAAMAAVGQDEVRASEAPAKDKA